MTRPPALAWLAFLGLTFCQVDAGELAESSHDDGSAHAIYYELSWDNAATIEHTDGWSVTNDLGYEVRVRDGELISTTVQLVPCTHARVWFGLPPALAGHSEGEADPSAVETELAESLPFHPTMQWDARISDSLYCASYLEVGALQIEFDVLSPGATTWSQLSIERSVTVGRQSELSDSIDSGSYATLIVFERQLASLFDGIDFDNWSPDDVGNAIMTNALTHTTITIFTD
jgi:hypothetical protein